MKDFSAVVCLAAVLLAPVPAVHAGSPDDPVSWLGRIASASRQLNYSGIFTYQTGRQSETSRIAHMVGAAGERERLEVLDGSPREVIRSNSEVRCVLPEQKMVIIDEAASRRMFPARVPASFSRLADHYRISKGRIDRVAGYDAQLIVLEPLDALRYGHLFWAELQSGLLLKARMVDENGEVIEQFAFSEVKIGNVDRELLSPHYHKGGDWRVVNTRGSEVRKEDAGWVLAEALPGFTLSSVVRRPLGAGDGEVVHMVFSDGLASVSVFIEPLGEPKNVVGAGARASGAIAIYKRPVDGHLVTALGEVPLLTVQRLGDAIRPATP